MILIATVFWSAWLPVHFLPLKEELKTSIAITAKIAKNSGSQNVHISLERGNRGSTVCLYVFVGISYISALYS